RYRFITNNCAVETWKLLHDGVPRLAGERLSSITPTGLLRKLARAGIADVSVLDDPARALRLGHRFAPANAHYQAMFDVARAALDLPQAGVEEWLDLAPGRRAPWLERGDLRAGAALLLLEETALRREELLARDQLKRLLSRPGGAAGGDARARLQEVLGLEDLFSRPAALLPAGYGLPQRGEREHLAAEAARQAARLHGQAQSLRDKARALLPPDRRARLDAIDANIAFLGRRLRQLHRESGGLDLGRPRPGSTPPGLRTPGPR